MSGKKSKPHTKNILYENPLRAHLKHLFVFPHIKLLYGLFAVALPFNKKAFSILYHKEYYFSASQFSLLVTNWLHKSRVLRMRNVSVS